MYNGVCKLNSQTRPICRDSWSVGTAGWGERKRTKTGKKLGGKRGGEKAIAINKKNMKP